LRVLLLLAVIATANPGALGAADDEEANANPYSLTVDPDAIRANFWSGLATADHYGIGQLIFNRVGLGHLDFATITYVHQNGIVRYHNLDNYVLYTPLRDFVPLLKKETLVMVLNWTSTEALRQLLLTDGMDDLTSSDQQMFGEMLIDANIIRAKRTVDYRYRERQLLALVRARWNGDLAAARRSVWFARQHHILLKGPHIAFFEGTAHLDCQGLMSLVE